MQFLIILFLFFFSPLFAEPPSQGMTVLQEVSTTFSEIAEKATPAVVTIQAFYHKKNTSHEVPSDFFYHFFGHTPKEMQPKMNYGSGFFVTDDGYILTNNHLVKDADRLTVGLEDGRSFDAVLIGSDPNTEVALIKVEGKNFPHLEMADSDQVKVGQWAIAIGNPFSFQSSVTVGIVSAVGRHNLKGSPWENYIQTDAAINSGSSGGPLLNIEGKVVGINTAIITNSGGFVGLSFAIPSNIATHVADQLLAYGHVERGYLGVSVQSMTPDLAEALQLPAASGVVIVEVAPGSPAEKAGLQPDDIIIEFNGKPIKNQGTLIHEIALVPPGTKTSLVINRKGDLRKIDVTMGQNPQDVAAEKQQVSQNVLGIEVQDLSPEKASQLGYTGEEGVLISKILPGSPLIFASVKPGTLILSVDREKVTNVEQFNKVLLTSSKNKRVLLLVKYGNVTRFITLNIK